MGSGRGGGAGRSACLRLARVRGPRAAAAPMFSLPSPSFPPRVRARVGAFPFSEEKALLSPFSLPLLFRAQLRRLLRDRAAAAAAADSQEQPQPAEAAADGEQADGKQRLLARAARAFGRPLIGGDDADRQAAAHGGHTNLGGDDADRQAAARGGRTNLGGDGAGEAFSRDFNNGEGRRLGEEGDDDDNKKKEGR